MGREWVKWLDCVVSRRPVMASLALRKNPGTVCPKNRYKEEVLCDGNAGGCIQNLGCCVLTLKEMQHPSLANLDAFLGLYPPPTPKKAAYLL